MMPASSSPIRGSYTLAEILSQPEVWRSCLRGLAEDAAFQTMRKKAGTRRPWLFIGCGTSFYLAEAAAGSWSLLTGQPARALPASEVLLFPQSAQLAEQDLQAVIISRSGRTSEALRAADLLRGKYKIATLGITCAPQSELEKTCELTIALPAADEQSVVMTRSFTSMLLALVGLAAQGAGLPGISSSLETVETALASSIEDWNGRVASFIAGHSFADYVYLGQGPFFPMAREAALKVTEMSHSYAQAYHTLEFRHGPKSIVAPQTCIAFFLSQSGMQAETEVLLEMKDLGGTIVSICDRASEAVRRASDVLFELRAGVSEPFLLAPFIVPAQLLGYHTGVKKHLNPDEPKNLSRVVLLD
ncbi:MAG: SIS domain-containing protein [Candidatus Acidiferrum sp.]|jgi:glucosamine--fructose-6-phosphate aminotransferase (isomerizing)